MDAQIIFNECTKNYNNCCELISNMATLVKQLDPEFDEAEALAHFDLVLQALLIKVAMADKKVAPIECEFIEKIVNHADLLDYICYKYEIEKMEWDAFSVVSKKTLRDILKLLDEDFKGIAESFWTPFAAVDALVKEVDMCEMLTRYITNIVMGLVSIDGKISEKEAKKTIMIVIEDFLQVYGEVVRYVNSQN